MQPVIPIRLSELSANIRLVLDRAFLRREFWVLADITNHSYREQKNYHSFELVEKDPASDGFLAKFSGKAWGKGAGQVLHFESVTGQRFTNNIQVLVLVRVVYHEVYGLSLDLIDLDTRYTVGKLFEQRGLTLEKLVRENDFIQKIPDGYWTKNKALPLPVVLQNIAIISSLNSAGMEDFKHCLASNPRGYRFFIDEYLTVVQGEANAHQLLDRLISVFTSGKAYDIVVMIRGGGAQTDFLIFDNYKISQAVAKFPIPIITGIGHQKNETITDLMAHTATKTPTQAAEFIIDHNRVFEEKMINLQRSVLVRAQQAMARQDKQLNSLNSVIINRTRTLLEHNDKVLANWCQSLQKATMRHFYEQAIGIQKTTAAIMDRSRFLVSENNTSLKGLVANISGGAAQFLKSSQTQLKNYQSIIRLMSPAAILKRGFAIVKIKDKIICRPEDIEIGTDIDILLSDNLMTATVKHKKTDHGTDFDI